MASGSIAKPPFDFFNFPTGQQISGVNLNNYKSTGIWSCAGNITNGPGSNYGVLICFYVNATSSIQIYLPSGANNIYYRRYSSDGWGSWQKVSMTSVS